jgi:hypothetical protein
MCSGFEHGHVQCIYVATSAPSASTTAPAGNQYGWWANSITVGLPWLPTHWWAYFSRPLWIPWYITLHGTWCLISYFLLTKQISLVNIISKIMESYITNIRFQTVEWALVCRLYCKYPVTICLFVFIS